jgi:hypothetical protein
MELAGGCTCGSLRYKITTDPIFVHACHCTDCQRTSGSAFLVNVSIHRDDLIFEGEVLKVTFPTCSGAGQEVYYCSMCATYICSNYLFTNIPCLCVRAGTLDDTKTVEPKVHIFTRSKLPWLSLGGDTPCFQEGYDPSELWPKQGLARFQ